MSTIYITIPAQLRRTINVTYLRTNIRILVRGPVTTDVTRTRSLIGRTTAAGYVLRINRVRHFGPTFRRLRGILGARRLLTLRTHHVDPCSRQTGSISMILSLVVRSVSLLLRLTDSRISALATDNKQVTGSDCLSCIATALNFDGNVITALATDGIARHGVHAVVTRYGGSLARTSFLGGSVLVRHRAVTSYSDSCNRILCHRSNLVRGICADGVRPLRTRLRRFVGYIHNNRRPSINNRRTLGTLHLTDLVRRVTLSNGP